MGALAWIALAFLAGVTVFGLLGSVLELLVGERLSFAPPFTKRSHAGRLIVAPFLAGPMMLFNDALDARGARRISSGQFLACAVTCLVWTCAMGVVMLELLALVTHL